MNPKLDNQTIMSLISDDELQELFVRLGWDRPEGHNPQSDITIQSQDDDIGTAERIAKKSTVAIYKVTLKDGGDEDLLSARTKSIVNSQLGQHSSERIMIISDPEQGIQEWVFAEHKRAGSLQRSTHTHRLKTKDDELCRKLRQIYFGPKEQDAKAHEVLEKVKKNFDTSKVTNKFFKEFKELRKQLQKKISGIETDNEKYWYSILILNRLMFIWFLQKKGFLNNGDQDYLETCLKKLRELGQKEGGKKNFYQFYRDVLLPMFHDYFGRGKILEANPHIKEIIGKVPYINGGIFAVHPLEQKYDIEIPNKIFDEIFSVFRGYTWHMGDIDGSDPKDINPDILGYIFEQHVNQKGIGAFYTKEDITQYMCSRTIAPLMIDRICAKVPGASDELWQILKESPRSYIPTALFHGKGKPETKPNFATWDGGRKSWSGIVAELKDHDLPGYPDPESKPELLAAMEILGEDTLPGYLDPWLSQKAQKDEDCPYRLPGETNREALERIEWAKKLEAKIEAGKVSDTSECITLNLEITQLLIDWLTRTESAGVIGRAWEELRKLRVLDPTGGSGAFLRAALATLEDLYEVVQSASERLQLRETPPQKSYKIRRTIIVNNLYANELSKEATEICQLRMFLALASCIENVDDIEPLPDLDLNMRSGNLLVGAESLDDAITRYDTNLEATDLADELETQQQNIELHQQFMQAQDNNDTELSLEIKEKIQKLEEQQRATLDNMAFTNRENKSLSFAEWKTSHSPFHWSIEFPEAMQDGGFDVVIGNPPFISKKIVNEGTDEFPGYFYSGFETDDCPDIYAPCMERSANLLKPDGKFAMISPISITAGLSFESLRQVIQKRFPSRWISSYDIRPSALFEASVHPVITIGSKHNHKGFYTSILRRFSDEYRKYLFSTVRFCQGNIAEDMKKIWIMNGSSEIQEFISSMKQRGEMIKNHIKKGTSIYVGYKKIRNRRFYSVFLIDPPCWEDNSGIAGKRTRSTTQWSQFNNDVTKSAVFLYLAGRIGYTLWAAVSDGFNVTTGVATWKPLSLDGFNVKSPALSEMSALTSKCQIRNLGIDRNNGYVGNFDLTKCRHITDLSDKLILETLGFPNIQPHMLLANDWLVKSPEKPLMTPEELGKTWAHTYGPWGEGMPE